jgi:hypothetical protein
MYDQINNQFTASTKQFADNAMKAQQVAFEGFERVLGLQLKTFEQQIGATMAFLGEAVEVRDFEAAKAFFPKSVALIKDSAEQMYSTSQEVLGQTIKTNEALGLLVKNGFESANETVVKAVKASKVAAK